MEEMGKITNGATRRRGVGVNKLTEWMNTGAPELAIHQIVRRVLSLMPGGGHTTRRRYYHPANLPHSDSAASSSN